jgi:hypothetical protein
MNEFLQELNSISTLKTPTIWAEPIGAKCSSAHQKTPFWGE